MKFKGVRVSLFILFVLGFSMLTSISDAAGPVTAQQSVAQAQTALTEASLGWHRWGWGYGGWGYRGWGGWGYRGWGWGGYPWYGGYSYVNPVFYSSPVIYTYPTYAYVPTYYVPTYYVRRPLCYSGCSYVVPFQSNCCCSATYTAPATTVSGYAYPSTTLAGAARTYSPTTASSSTYAPSSYVSSRSTAQGNSLSSMVRSNVSSYSSTRGSDIYTPTLRNTGVASTGTRTAQPLSVVRSTRTSTSAPVAAPYPAPPVEYAKPVTVRTPIARKPIAADEHETIVPARTKGSSLQSSMKPAGYSSPVAQTIGGNHSAYSPATQFKYSAITPLASRIDYSKSW